MNYKLKTLKLSAILVALLSSIQITKAAAPISKHPSRTEGTAFGFGVGAKLLNLKNISTINVDSANALRSHDGMASTSSPVLSIFARKYIPDLLPLPMFGGLEFNYLTQMRKNSIYAKLNPAVSGLDTGYRYEERWDARAMVGVQVLEFSQLDFWAQAGLQLTYFDYQGITNTAAGSTQRFNMHNNYALAPTGGLEMRFSQPNAFGLFEDKSVVTDFILGWTAGYRNAFKVIGTDSAGTNSYEIAMSSNWSHTFGLKVMFRF